MQNQDSDDHIPRVETQPEAGRGGSGGRGYRVRTRYGGEDDGMGPLLIAQQEARRLKHNFVGTEFLLVGLAGFRKGMAAHALSEFDITMESVRQKIEERIGYGTGFVAKEIPFTPRVKGVLEQSWAEARMLGDNFIGSEHLLLALIGESEGLGAQILEELGVDLELLRAKILLLVESA